MNKMLVKIFVCFFIFIIISVIYFLNKEADENAQNVTVKESEVVLIEGSQNHTLVRFKNRNFYFQNFYYKKVKENMITSLLKLNKNITTVNKNQTSKIKEKETFPKSSQPFFYSTTKLFNKFYINNLKFLRGYDTFESQRNNNCPFSSSKILLKDEMQIIYLRATYSNNETLKFPKNCSWDLQAPTGFGFKFVALNFSLTEKFNIINSTGDFVTTGKYTAQKLKPYYNEDDNIRIFLHNATQSPESGGFNAYVSVARKYQFKTNISYNIEKFACRDNHIHDPENIKSKEKCARFTWSNLHNHSDHEYQNNLQSQIKMKIEPNQELYAHIIYDHYEKGVDIVKYYNGSEDYRGRRLEEKNYTVFYPLENSTGTYPKDVTFEFTSDGSVQGEGFVVEFDRIDCECGTPNLIIPCNGDRNYSIMGSYTYSFCANLICKYSITIEDGCPEKYGVLKVISWIPYIDWETGGKHRVIGNFLVISNEKIILNSTAKERAALITPGSDTTLIFRSTKIHKYDKKLRDGLGNPTQANKVILTPENPVQIRKLKTENMAITAELSKDLKDAGDELLYFPSSPSYHITTLGCFNIYAGRGFSHLLGNLYHLNNTETLMAMYAEKNFSDNYGFSDSRKLVSMTVYRHYHCTNKTIDSIIMVFIARRTQAVNCNFNKTIFNIRKNGWHNISMISSHKGSCEIIIAKHVPDSSIFFVKIWTNSNNHIVTVYNGINKREKVLEFDKTSFWETMILNGLFYVIKIPPNSSIILNLFSTEFPFNLSEIAQTFTKIPFYWKPHKYPFKSDFLHEIVNNDTILKTDVIDIMATTNLTLNYGTKNLTKFTASPGLNLTMQLNDSLITSNEATIKLSSPSNESSFYEEIFLKVYSCSCN